MKALGKVARLVEAARRVHEYSTGATSYAPFEGDDRRMELARALDALTPADVALADGADALEAHRDARWLTLCSECHAPNVETESWVKINSGVIGQSSDGIVFCPDCETNGPGDGRDVGIHVPDFDANAAPCSVCVQICETGKLPAQKEKSNA
jgi:hypothetical protein